MKLLQLSALIATAFADDHIITAWKDGPTYEIIANGEAKKAPTELTFTVTVPKDMYIQLNMGTNAKKNTDWITFANENKVGKVLDMFEDEAKKMDTDKKNNLVKVSEKTDDKTGVVTFVYTRLMDTKDTDEDFVSVCGKDWEGKWQGSKTTADT